MIVRHPTLPGVERDVPDPDTWEEHGWIPDRSDQPEPVDPVEPLGVPDTD